MIVTVQKPLGEIRKSAAPFRRLGIIGCGGCAAVCQTGGTKQVENLARQLTNNEIVFTFQIDEPCDHRVLARELKRISGRLTAVDAVLMLACGTGVQVMASKIEKPCLTGLNTVFPGAVIHSARYEELCFSCGECILNWTAGVCPRTQCPKGIANGPCSEKIDDRCSVDPDNECVWVSIEKRKALFGLDTEFELPLVDWSRTRQPGRIPANGFSEGR